MRSIRSRAPKSASAAVRRSMQANTGRETSIETTFFGLLKSLGHRFSRGAKPVKPLRCTADAVFRRERVSVFVDGCFWHGCPEHFLLPKSNTEWWREKIEDNRRRDMTQTNLLRSRGWSVMRIWEHDVRRTDRHPAIAAEIERRLTRRRRIR